MFLMRSLKHLARGSALPKQSGKVRTQQSSQLNEIVKSPMKIEAFHQERQKTVSNDSGHQDHKVEYSIPDSDLSIQGHSNFHAPIYPSIGPSPNTGVHKNTDSREPLERSAKIAETHEETESLTKDSIGSHAPKSLESLLKNTRNTPELRFLAQFNGPQGSQVPDALNSQQRKVQMSRLVLKRQKHTQTLDDRIQQLAKRSYLKTLGDPLELLVQKVLEEVLGKSLGRKIGHSLEDTVESTLESIIERVIGRILVQNLEGIIQGVVEQAFERVLTSALDKSLEKSLKAIILEPQDTPRRSFRVRVKNKLFLLGSWKSSALTGPIF